MSGERLDLLYQEFYEGVFRNSDLGNLGSRGLGNSLETARFSDTERRAAVENRWGEFAESHWMFRPLFQGYLDDLLDKPWFNGANNSYTPDQVAAIIAIDQSIHFGLTREPDFDRELDLGRIIVATHLYEELSKGLPQAGIHLTSVREMLAVYPRAGFEVSQMFLKVRGNSELNWSFLVGGGQLSFVSAEGDKPIPVYLRFHDHRKANLLKSLRVESKSAVQRPGGDWRVHVDDSIMALAELSLHFHFS